MSPNIASPYFAELARGVHERAHAGGLSLLIGFTAESIAAEADYIALFGHHAVRGLVLATRDLHHQQLRALRARGIESVIVGPHTEDMDQMGIAIDDELGGRLAAEHLVEIGRRRIAFAGGSLDIDQVARRRYGAEQTARSRGAEFLTIPVGREIESGPHAAERIAALPPAQRPDAVFAVNDLVALGLLKGLTTDGVRVPEDIAIIGFDDNRFSAVSLIPLSAIRVSQSDMSSHAVKMLLKSPGERNAMRDRLVAPRLIVRASTRIS